MKQVKRIFAFAMTLVMALAVALPAFAQDDAAEPAATAGPASIKITLPTDPAPTGTTIYKIYKVFNATSDGNTDAISYTLIDNKNLTDAMKTYFDVDSAGNVTAKAAAKTASGELTADAIAAIADYVAGDTAVKTVNVPAGQADVTVSGLDYGYYFISTNTGTVVTVDSTNPTANVNDKNKITTVVKSAGTEYDEDALQAIAQVGTDQPFTAQITIAKGAINVVFEDTMTNMQYNKDVQIKVEDEAVAASKYTVELTNSGFKVNFTNDYIATLDPGTVITLNYTGKVTSDALSVNPATNTATVTTGEDNQNTQTSKTVEVYNAKFTVKKTDGDKTQNKPLAGAGFVIKNSAGNYYKIANNVVSWVASIDEATEYTSDAQGNVPAFKGLGVGTYTLVEKTVPAGYNKAADYNFTIADGNYKQTNLEQQTTVENFQGTEMPSTGGIGTTIFYVVGGVLVAGSVVMLLTKRRMADAE